VVIDFLWIAIDEGCDVKRTCGMFPHPSQGFLITDIGLRNFWEEYFLHIKEQISA